MAAALMAAETIDRLYVLDGGTCQVEDISQWSPGVDEGVPGAFSDNVYLFRHGDRWVVWDTGLDESLVGEPDGRVFAHDVRGVVRRTLSSQFEEIGVLPGEVDILLLSHALRPCRQHPPVPAGDLVRAAC